MTDAVKKETVERDCSTAGKGFARTEGSDVVAEDCALPDGQGKGFAKSEAGQPLAEPAAASCGGECATAGKGFARTEDNAIVAEDCALPDGPGKGFSKTD